MPRALVTTLYNAFFLLALPVLLFAWAGALDPLVMLPALPPWAGTSLVAIGGGLMVWSMVEFFIATGHTPSNARPSQLRVTGGPYILFSDPIYLGFAFLMFGAAALYDLAAGFWIVAPLVTLLAAALVFGHEALRRPPLAAEHQRSLLSLPAGGAGQATVRQRCGGFLHMLAVAIFAQVVAVAANPDWTGTLLLVGVTLASALPSLSPLISTGWGLRRLLIGYDTAIIVFALAYAGSAVSSLPTHGVAPAAAIGALAGVWAAARKLPTAAASVIVIGAVALLAWQIGPAVLQPVMLGILTAAIAVPLHHVMRCIAEAIANSWSAIRFGPVRVINYAIYAFAGALVCALVFTATVRPSPAPAALIIAACVFVSAALWGQLVEFSGRLARPFGYYGALIGAFLGVGIAVLTLKLSPWLMGAALVLAAPAVQAVGRLRCLVQGCCHGAHVHEPIRGIVYRRPHSRVVRLAGLGGQPVHPTPLYSIYANLAALILLWRLAGAGCPQTLLIAIYLIFSGATRFIEEAWRGEPQTPVWRTLKLYQWLAIAQILAGVVISLVSSPPVPALSMPTGDAILASLAIGLLGAIAMGVDFPKLRSRFSQLTPNDS